MQRIATEVMYYQNSVMPLAARAKDAAGIAMSLALWARAFLSLDGKGVNQAISMMGWSNVKSITWRRGLPAESDDGGRLDSSTMAELLALTGNASVQASMMRSGMHQVDAIYLDFVALLALFDAYFHFAGIDMCMASTALVWEKTANEFLLCFVRGLPRPTDWNNQDGKREKELNRCLDWTTVSFKKYALQCPWKIPEDFDLYLTRLKAMYIKGHDHGLDPQQLSTALSSTRRSAETEVDKMLQTARGELGSFLSMDRTAIPWMILAFIWGTSPLIYLSYRFCKLLHSQWYY